MTTGLSQSAPAFHPLDIIGDGIGSAVRGPAYWPGTPGVGPRIYSQTTTGLAAIDAKTGTLVTTFGTNGVLQNIRHNSPPVGGSPAKPVG